MSLQVCVEFLRATASIAISYGNSVCLSWCHVPVPFQDQVR